MNDTKDYPVALKINDAATDLAPTIYYVAHKCYGGTGKMFDVLPPAERAYYRDVAEALLRTVAPSERNKPTPPKLAIVPKTDKLMPEFHEGLPPPTTDGWCAQCHTRQTSKHHHPYCSTLCRDTAAQRDEPRRI